MRSFLLFHFIPIIIAGIIIYLIFNSGTADFYLFPEKTKRTEIKFPEKQSGYFSNYGEGYQTESDLCFALANKSIVVFGSSELAESSVALPFNFIPSHTGYPTVGIGHAGNQCLCMLTQLCALSDYIESAKIVFIVSPGWFKGEAAYGTSTELFLEYNSNRFLINILLSAKLPEQFKNYIFKYVAENMKNINAPNTALRLMFNTYESDVNLIKHISYIPLLKWNQFLLNSEIHLHESLFKNGFEKVSIHLPEKSNLSNSKNNQFKYQSLNWDSLYSISKLNAQSSATNNNMGVYDDYYNQNIKGKYRQKIPSVGTRNNKELQDFKMLLDFLKYYKTNASFIIQPLNPHYYSNLSDMDVVVNEIEKEIIQHQFDYINLFTSDTIEYEKALLKDIMHMGDYGWYKMNQFVIDKYLAHE